MHRNQDANSYQMNHRRFDRTPLQGTADRDTHDAGDSRRQKTSYRALHSLHVRQRDQFEMTQVDGLGDYFLCDRKVGKDNHLRKAAKKKGKDAQRNVPIRRLMPTCDRDDGGDGKGDELADGQERINAEHKESARNSVGWFFGV